MIVGIGIDICSVDRLARLRRRYGARFLDRVFSAAEQQRCGQGPACDERYAARFAAKEAFMKATGLGWRGGITFRDIEILTRDHNRPELTLHGVAGEQIAARGVTALHVSLSHERDNAVAVVVLEK
jgi:holo-[acyl-carrier protein] synthase